MAQGKVSNLAKRNLPIILGLIVVIAIGGGAIVFYSLTSDNSADDFIPGACAIEGTGAILETNFGDIVISFIPRVAPCHIANFVTLANEGFYDGTSFHRVIPGFMVQGGDPNTRDEDRNNDGLGGPGYEIQAEFSGISHTRGIVSMARSAEGPDTAGSQFFIVVGNAPFLDGQYSVFGEVVEGMDVVDLIVSVETDSNDNPLERIWLNKVTIIDA
jgi:peptidyl-prolyl cis-trans isomerase B (cyclophilin B)